MFCLPALAALNSRPVASQNSDGALRTRVSLAWTFVVLVLTALIGFRYEVGGDWYSYIGHFEAMEALGWSFAISQSEPGHWLVNKAMSALGWGMTGVNVLYGCIFSVGLAKFLKTLPRPWLALATAVPYLVIVVAMGYSRQATALGFAMIGLVAIRHGSFLKFLIWVLIGATFHNTVIVMLPLVGLVYSRSRLQGWIGVIIISYAAYYFLLADRLQGLVDVYIDRRLTDSHGTLIRLGMNAAAGVLFLLGRKIFTLSDGDRNLWTIISLGSILMLAAYFATGLSTALDRIALYFLPLQLVAFAHLPDALGQHGRRNIEIVLGILMFYAAVLFVWLNFAVHSEAWVPFRIGITG